MQRTWAVLCVIATAFASSTTSQQAIEASAPLTPNVASVDDTRMLAGPAVSATHIAFEYADDLWIANLDGTGARRITTHSGRELNPRFSPDGRLLAFSAQYDGNTDVFVVSVDGGVPERLTWHPGADLVQEFTPDGERVLFTSPRAVYTRRHRQLFTVSIVGGQPDALPIPTAFKASYSADGSKLAYTPLYEAFRQWKNYRGGTVTRIWIYDTATHAVVQVPQPDSRCNDTDPMWVDGTVYFVSDRNGEFNLFSYTAGDAGVEQLTRHADFPILSASAGAGHIVYEQAGYLHLFHPENASSARLRVAVAADLMETRPRYVDGSEYIRGATVSPSGARAAFEYRGEIITLPREKGDARNLTRTAGAHERHPAWSPDGQWIAYFSDASGEYELFIAPQSGRGEGRTFALPGAGFYDDPEWSPDSQKISFTDNSWTYYVLDVETGEVQSIAQEPLYGPLKTMHHAWSPDSRWIAYTLNTRNYFKQVHLFDVESGESRTITDGLGDVAEPVFDAGGKYLYFTASTDAGPVNTWFAMSNADMEQSNALFLAVLSQDTPSPLARESDEEENHEETPDEADDEAEEESVAPEEQLVAIDFEGIRQRIIALPTGTANFSNLAPGKEGQLYYLKGEDGAAFGDGGGQLTRFDLAEREETALMDKASGFALAAGKDKLLVAAKGQFWIAAAGGKIDPTEGQLAVDKLQVKIDPRAEWAQIFDEAWRINRDYFYDPNFHGANWPAVRDKYAGFLPYLATRSDLNRVIGWVCSELAVGHSRNGGGDTLVETDDVPGGLLGADFEVEGDRHRFAKVYGGLNWNPELRAPLTEPGIGVQAGDYLLAVEGRDLRASENLYSRFENTVGKTVELEVGPSADGTNARTVSVVPIANEAALRNRAWVESNIAKVTEATDGRVAYVYVPNTADMGHAYFKRYFFPQAGREAIIVDERHNGGGQVADYYIDILRRPYISHWAMRYGEDLITPQGAILGPKVMLIDETAGSGGDLLPWMFRKLELGQLIGRRTWGGLVGTLGFPTLMDGGGVTAPNLAIWTEAGFIVENEGVAPDIEVEQLPADVIAGRDPQLEKAIEVILEQLAENPPPSPQRPPYPTRVRK